MWGHRRETGYAGSWTHLSVFLPPSSSLLQTERGDTLSTSVFSSVKWEWWEHLPCCAVFNVRLRLRHTCKALSHLLGKNHIKHLITGSRNSGVLESYQETEFITPEPLLQEKYRAACCGSPATVISPTDQYITFCVCFCLQASCLMYAVDS